LLLNKATKVARKLADYYAFGNNWIFEQIMRFNFRRNARSLEMLEKLKENIREVYRQKETIIDQLEDHLRNCRQRQEYQLKTKPAF
jgi:flagellin-specific chaperone FliS